MSASPSGPAVVLVGPPGAGKTTVAALIAEQLRLEVRDTDADVETATGLTVAEIFVDRGESAFRELEEEAVAKALVEHAGVLSLGGGAVLSSRTREALQPQRVAFLQVGLANAVRRVGLGASRPLLLGNVRSTLKRLLDERDPLYREVADVVVDTDDREPADVAQRVIELLRGTGE